MIEKRRQQIPYDSFAVAVLNTFDLTNLSINTHKAKDSLKNELIDDFEDLNTEVTKTARLEHFKLKDVQMNDYSERYLELDHKKGIIYGIRHKGGNPNIPFIQIVPNFEIKSKEMALAIYHEIKNEFKVFAPKYICFQTKSKINADLFGSIYMVSRTQEMKGLAPWPSEKDLTFKDINDDNYYEWYKSEYAIFHKNHPKLKDKVTVNSKDIMEVSLKQNLLKFVEINGETIGLIAGEKSEFLSHTGLYFNEILISKKWKDKGIAKAIQRKFISLFAKEIEYVWGTIDHSNLPSYKTAYSNGRKPVRHECFIRLGPYKA